MKEIKVGKPKGLVVPLDVDNVEVTHEWGDVVTTASGLVPEDIWTFTPDSIGVHKITWRDGTTALKTEFYSAFVPLITATEFFLEHEDLQDFEEFFPALERTVRGIVQNYTGQKFGPYVNKSLDIQGDGGDALILPVRVVALSSVGNTLGDDLTDMIMVSPNEPSHLLKLNRFSGSNYYEPKRDLWSTQNMFGIEHTFTITGTFGWEFVPIEVSDAASVLIADIMGSDDVAEMRRKGVFEAQIGDFSMRLNADQWGTTGNTVADNLLAGYTTIGFGLI